MEVNPSFSKKSCLRSTSEASGFSSRTGTHTGKVPESSLSDKGAVRYWGILGQPACQWVSSRGKAGGHRQVCGQGLQGPGLHKWAPAVSLARSKGSSL